MGRIQKEEKLTEDIKEFVGGLNGVFNKHVSDEFLSSVMFRSLVTDPEFLRRMNKEKTCRSDAGYHRVCWIFEAVLEHACGCYCNGHHVAQIFEEFLIKKGW